MPRAQQRQQQLQAGGIDVLHGAGIQPQRLTACERDEIST